MSHEISNCKVGHRKEFTTFIHLLRSDLSANPENWENKTLADFLEAMEGYSEDIQGYYDNMKLPTDANTASWQVFGDILKGSSVYE